MEWHHRGLTRQEGRHLLAAQSDPNGHAHLFGAVDSSHRQQGEAVVDGRERETDTSFLEAHVISTDSFDDDDGDDGVAYLDLSRGLQVHRRRNRIPET